MKKTDFFKKVNSIKNEISKEKFFKQFFHNDFHQAIKLIHLSSIEP